MKSREFWGIYLKKVQNGKLKISNNYISKGKYTFPFEMDIPDNIPASFLYIDNNKGYGYIESELTHWQI